MRIKGAVEMYRPGGAPVTHRLDLDLTLTEREERLLLLAAALTTGTNRYHPHERVARAVEALDDGSAGGKPGAS